MGLTSVSNQISKIADASAKLSNNGITKLSNLAGALSKLNGIGEVRISASIGRQLSSIADAAVKLQSADLTKLTQLADAMRPLSTLSGAHLTSYINQLGKLPQVINDLHAADLDRFIAEVQRLNAALTPFGQTMERISNGFSAFPSRIQRLIQSTERYNETMNRANRVTQAGKSNGLWGFLNSSYSKYLALSGVFAMISNTLGGFVERSAEYSENLNLFTVAMGRYAQEAYSYAESVQAALGIDMSEWMRNQGIFMQIATGFGVIEEKAYTMSQGLTQIAYDIASFYNISTEEALQKVQSGISGELEPLRRLGYALDAATLQQIAYDNGIKQNINTMTQAQKSQLRYVAIMEQSTNAMGDMARTIMSPANALRIVNMQLEQLERAMGNAILPLLMEILPYAQAAIMVLTDAINKLAVLFGFELPEIDYSTLGGLQSGAEDATGAIDETTEAVQDLKNAVLGIDELNVLSPQTPNGGGNAYDLPIDIESYDFFTENYQNRVNEIAHDIKDFFDTYGEGIVTVSAALIAFGTGLATGSKIINFITHVKNLAEGFDLLGGSISAVSGIAAGAAGAVAMIAGVIDSINNGLDFSNLTTILVGTTTAITGLGLAFGPIGAVVGAAAGAVAAFTAAFVDVMNNGFNSENIAALAAVVAALTAMAFLFNPMAAIITGIAAAAAALAVGLSQETIPEVKIFDDSISRITQEKAQPFIEQVMAMSDALAKLEFTNAIVTDDDVSQITSLMSQVRETILTELEMDKASVEEKLAPIREALGDDLYTELIEANNRYYADIEQKVKDGESRVTEIFAAAASENRSLTTAEWEEVNRIRDELTGMGLQSLSESQQEYLTIMENIKTASTRISAEQALDIIEDAKKTRDEAISAANSQYIGVLYEAQKLYEAGYINKNQYDAMMRAAEETRDSTIADARTQYDTILSTVKEKMGEIADNIDWESGKIKTYWQILWEDSTKQLKDFWDDSIINTQNFFIDMNNLLNRVGRWIGDGMIGITNGIIGGIEGLINGGIEGINSLIRGLNKISFDLPDWLGGGSFGFDIDALKKINIPRIPVETFATGGYPDEGQLFIARERGAEMVGSIGGRTAVANNDQIVEAISTAVYNAMMAAESNRGKNDGGNHFYLDGEEVDVILNKRKKTQGMEIYSGGVI